MQDLSKRDCGARFDITTNIHSLGEKRMPKNPDVRNPPAWLNRLGYWFRLGLILFSVITLLLGTAACSSSQKTTTTPPSWQPAAQITPKETLLQIVSSHSSLSDPETAIKTMRVWQVNGTKGRLNLYNFNHPSLCGQMGCLYVGYLIPNNKSQLPTEVFATYLNPNVPPKIDLFQAETGATQDGIPCLLVSQQASEGRRQLKFCYNGSTYQLADSQLFREGKGIQGRGDGGTRNVQTRIEVK